MAKQRYKRVQAGRLVREALWTPVFPYDTPAQRAAKSRVSSAARKKINQRLAWKKLMLLLAANFTGRDLHVVLTYDDDHLPANAAAARKFIKRFLAALRQHRRAKGEELLYIYNIEGRHGSGRLHHHIVLKAGDKDVLQKLWPYGLVLPPHRIDRYGYSGLAQYLTKEAREESAPVGARSWVGSLNLQKPAEAPTEWVPDSIRLEPPTNAYILERDEQSNEFGRFQYVEYLLPDPPLGRRVRPPQRKE